MKKKKTTRVTTISKTEAEQILRLILWLSLLIPFGVFGIHAHALVSTT